MPLTSIKRWSWVSQYSSLKLKHSFYRVIGSLFGNEVDFLCVCVGGGGRLAKVGNVKYCVKWIKCAQDASNKFVIVMLKLWKIWLVADESNHAWRQFVTSPWLFLVMVYQVNICHQHYHILMCNIDLVIWPLIFAFWDMWLCSPTSLLDWRPWVMQIEVIHFTDAWP